MKKIILTVGFLLVTSLAFAGHAFDVNNNFYSTHLNEDVNDFGAKLDAPYLIQFTDNLFLGFEGGKDLYRTDINEGWLGYGKITYTGTLFSFKKK